MRMLEYEGSILSYEVKKLSAPDGRIKAEEIVAVHTKRLLVAHSCPSSPVFEERLWRLLTMCACMCVSLCAERKTKRERE